MASAIKDSDSELRQRNVGSTQQPNTSPEDSSALLKPEASGNEDTSAIESDVGRVDEGADSDGPSGVDLSSVAKEIGQDGSSAGTQALETALGGLPPKWKNYTIRFIFTWLMIGGFCVFIYGGPLFLMFLTLFVQIKCFSEVINIGYAVYRVHNLPWFRTLSWYFLITSNYFFYGESMVGYFSILINKINVLTFLVRFHRFISFSMYVGGFVWFVVSLRKGYYMRQFSLFAWTHVALLIIVTQSYLIIQNLFEGLIWFILPIMMIIINDVMAYMFGFFLGKTPLIKLSPKKTWEGYLGGGFATVLMTMALGHVLAQYPFFICPVEFNENLGHATHYMCEPSYNFVLQEVSIPGISNLRQMMRMKETITIYPVLIHAFFMSTFASVIGPFGGFFASGFKRAFKIKDFGDIIPGHGGIMDRFDCQFLMATFVNAYIHSFIRSSSPTDLLQKTLTLKPEDQLALYYALQDSLKQRGILM